MNNSTDKKEDVDLENRNQNSGQQNQPNESIASQPKSPGIFITNDPNKLSEIPSAERALSNRGPLNKDTVSSDDYKIKMDAILNQSPNLKRTSNTNLLMGNEPKYTVTRTSSNLSLNLAQPHSANIQIENTTNSTSVDSRSTSRLSSQLEKSQSQFNLNRQSSRLPEIIEIASEREANIRNYEIEQFRNDENDLKEQFNDLLTKMSNLQKTLGELEARELEEVQQKRQEAEIFERETRERIEHLNVRKEELDRDASRLENRLKELKSLQRESEVNRNLNNKMRNEMGKCLRKLGKQYENGCRKYLKEIQEMESEATERRNRDRELMDQYKQKQNELAILLEEKMILRKSLEERNQLEKLLGQNGISLLVANQTEQKHTPQQESVN